jgi:hypothetical protein
MEVNITITVKGKVMAVSRVRDYGMFDIVITPATKEALCFSLRTALEAS